jgi:5-methylcytosine-specific restriction enzyme A
MSLKPGRFCVTPGCGIVVRAGRCAQHAVMHEHARPNYAVRRWYRTARWYAYRRQVLNLNPLCVNCQAGGQIVIATEIDHIRPHHDDPVLFWNLSNLQGLCASCHVQKTMRGE